MMDGTATGGADYMVPEEDVTGADGHRRGRNSLDTIMVETLSGETGYSFGGG